ncbi:MAG: hypothetical protein GF400_00240 [Candidatus Eisenbacteria bacterium]|nr:hypothetical protein [Candidatus Eisenbacteria bacterium]
MRHVRAAALAALCVAVTAASAGAYTYTGWQQYGDPLPPIDGRSMAMGGAGMASADGARGIGLNPALLGKNQGLQVAATAFGMAAEESRDVPLHDSFDGIIAENTFALNTGFYDHYMLNVAYTPPDDLTWAPTVGVGYGPRLDMNYKYHVQYRDPDSQTEPNDKILYDYYAEGDGAVSAFTVALGQEVYRDVHLGLGVDFIRGDFEDRERYVYPPDSEESDSETRWEYDDVSGTQFTAGLLVETLHRVDIAFVYRSAFDLDVDDYSMSATGPDSTASGSFTYGYPDAFAVGFEYHPRNLIMTTVSFDVEYVRWSEFEDGSVEEDPELDDTVVYRVGIEHGYYDDTQARFGFIYEPSYVDNTVARTGFCAGVGLNLLGARVDVGGRIMMREYDVGDATLKETTTQAMATLVHSF